jgi:hypothetical protein
MSPIKCVVLAVCPQGTPVPAFSYMWLVCVVVSVVVMLAFYMNVRRVERIQEQRAEAAGKHEILNMVRTLLARLQIAYGGEVKPHSILVEPIVRVEYSNLGMTLRGSGRSVLDGVTGMYQPGHLHAVMGPSGSGMFLDCPQGPQAGWTMSC